MKISFCKSEARVRKLMKKEKLENCAKGIGEKGCERARGTRGRRWMAAGRRPNFIKHDSTEGWECQLEYKGYCVGIRMEWTWAGEGRRIKEFPMLSCGNCRPPRKLLASSEGEPRATNHRKTSRLSPCSVLSTRKVEMLSENILTEMGSLKRTQRRGDPKQFR